MKRTLLLTLLLLLFGCDAEVDTQVNMTDLLSSENKVIPGDLRVEISSCHEGNSKTPSDALIEIQGKIPIIFDDAEYAGCTRNDFASYAHFNIPILLAKSTEGKLLSDSHINLISDPDTLLTLGIPEKIKNRIEHVGGEFGSLELGVNISITNDTGKPFPFHVISAYVEDEPHVFSSLTAKEGATFSVRLSDVSIDNALEKGTSVVLFR